MGVKTIKTFAERMRNEGVGRAIMVTQANMTPFARQCLAEMAPKYYIEVVGRFSLAFHATPLLVPGAARLAVSSAVLKSKASTTPPECPSKGRLLRRTKGC